MLRIACAIPEERRRMYLPLFVLCFSNFGRTEEVEFINKTEEEMLRKMGKGSIICFSCY